MHLYRVYDLTIGSDILIEELNAETETSRPVDIRIKRTEIGREVVAMGEASPFFDYEDARGVVMVWPGVAAFRIVDTSLIEIQPFPEAPNAYLAFPILGPIMGWMLHMRGLFVLHASAVCFEGKTIGFLGDKMAGKSTTAASFLRRGAQLMTDDLLAIDMDETPPLIRPAFAQLKLTEQAAAGVKVPGSEALPLVFEDFPKQQYKLASMLNTAQKCDFLFVLNREGDTPRIDWFSGEEALKSLLRFSYNVRFANAPIHMQERPRHFKQCARLTHCVKIGQLTIPKGLERLDATIDHVKTVINSSAL